MEKTLKEMMEEKWREGGCYRPLYPICWKLSYLGNFLLIRDNIIGVHYEED